MRCTLTFAYYSYTPVLTENYFFGRVFTDSRKKRKKNIKKRVFLTLFVDDYFPWVEYFFEAIFGLKKVKFWSIFLTKKSVSRFWNISELAGKVEEM